MVGRFQARPYQHLMGGRDPFDDMSCYPRYWLFDREWPLPGISSRRTVRIDSGREVAVSNTRQGEKDAVGVRLSLAGWLRSGSAAAAVHLVPLTAELPAHA